MGSSSAIPAWDLLRTDPRFEKFAVVAGESEVFAVVSSAMLASNDVLDVIGEERLRVLRKAAVFAAMIGTFADGLPEPLVHQAA
jgi:hypothetical protein